MTKEVPKIEDFKIFCNPDNGGGDIQYKQGGCMINVYEALHILLLKEISEKLTYINNCLIDRT